MSYKISFEKVGEIRMGSPYKGATAVISGGYVPELPLDFCYTTVFFLDQENDSLFLARWDIQNNNPAFVVDHFDNKNRVWKTSRRIQGACEKLFIKEKQLFANIYQNPNHLTVRIEF